MDWTFTESDYEQYLRDHEYRPDTIRTYVANVQKFRKWIELNPSPPQSMWVTLTTAYLDPCAAINGRPLDLKGVRAALHHHTAIARLYGQPCSSTAPMDPISQEVDAYAEYLTRVAGYSSATITAHRQVLKQFLRKVMQPPIAPQTVWFTASRVATFLTTAWRHLKPGSKKRYIGVIRGYIRYLAFHGVAVDPGLLQLPLAAPVWKLNTVPSTFSAEELEQLVRAFDRTIEAGIRDYAMYRCFIDLGLRVSEVADLTLDNWDWHHGTVRIHSRKTARERLLPVPITLGEAIVHYLGEARPKTTERTLFVRFAHLRGEPMGPGNIRRAMCRAYARVGISPRVTGTHILRHTKAASLYNTGADLKMIADILGHTSIDTTVVYTKIPGPALAAVSARWPTISESGVQS